MVVVKTFSVMETRRDHRNSTKDTGNWENKNKKKGRERKNKREMLAPTPAEPPPDRHQTTRPRTLTHPGGTRAGARVGRKSFF